MTVLLIGARGFAGRHFAAAARAAGLDLVTSSADGTDADLACDILDPASVARAFAEARPDAVVNMAGQASVGASWKQPRQTFELNTIGVLNLLEAIAPSAPDCYLLCVSSAEVYGVPEAGDLPLTEQAPVRPVTPYGSSKAAMEILVDQYARAYAVRAGVVRAFNQIGPGQAPDFAASSFSRQIAEAELRGEDRLEMTVGNLSAARDFTDIRDSARAYVAMVRSELIGTYNLCTGRALKIEELVDRMRSSSRLEVEIEVDPALVRQSDPPLVVGSGRRLQEATGWQPEIPIARTAADMLDWWRERLGTADAGLKMEEG
ncbi:MAG TPA: GDP-mannose 4,6-dehydratase [Solirubrobacterales bacterium]|nr:GDP-mannose 4,6-dehydratase [Solirubrobacterales bacterium]